jgi:hypothetical protein
VALLGLVTYLLWPPSAKSLYARAQVLMQSEEPGDWKVADDDYLKELDRLHPEHPFNDQVQKWRDQIDLNRVGRRAVILEKPNLGIVAQPKNEGEKAYFSVFEKTNDDIRANREEEAARRWSEMATALNQLKDPDARGWMLFAQKKAGELNKKLLDREQELRKQLLRAKEVFESGNKEEAIRLWQDVITKYEAFPYLKHYVDETRMHLTSLSPPTDSAENPPEKPAEKEKP